MHMPRTIRETSSDRDFVVSDSQSCATESDASFVAGDGEEEDDNEDEEESDHGSDVDMETELVDDGTDSGEEMV